MKTAWVQYDGGRNNANLGTLIFLSCDLPVDARKFWIKEQGGFTNQDPSAQPIVMDQNWQSWVMSVVGL
jgi:hypothetical protein